MNDSPTSTPLRSLCVYCGSASGRQPAYADAARALAQAMVARDIRLVYGGASVGIMGTVADEILRLGGEAVGVIPQALMRKELAHAGLTELHVTPSMHARKMLMAELADGFVALPGGIGTFEEIFEVWTWAQLGFHAKPCGLLDVNGYYSGLCAFLDHVRDQGFMKDAHRGMLLCDADASRLLDRLADYEPPRVQKWVRQPTQL